MRVSEGWAYWRDFGLRRCDARGYLFSKVLSDWPTPIHEAVNYGGAFQFQFVVFKPFELWTLSGCHLFVLQYYFDVPSYDSNIQKNSELPSFLFRYEIVKPLFFQTFVGFEFCQTNFEVLFNVAFAHARISEFYSTTHFWMKNHTLKTLNLNVFL